jgi:phosphoglucosamine mutase
VPQVLQSLNLPSRRAISDMPKLSKEISKAERLLGERGRVLVRWSGTEPKLRLMAEGPDPDKLEAMLADMADAARHDTRAPLPS